MSIKRIHLTQRHNCEHVLGKLLDHDAYDLVVNEDVDVYKPLTEVEKSLGTAHSENSILLKFRKNVFPKKMVRTAFEGLKTGATMTDNRGLAAGTARDEYQILPSGEYGARLWVTKRQKAIIEYFIAGSPRDLEGEDQLSELMKLPNSALEGRGATKTGEKGVKSIKGGSIWIVEKSKDFTFEAWLSKVSHEDIPSRRKHALEILNDLISDTTYGNGVLSGVAGYFDRYPRIPFCRMTGWTTSNLEKFEQGIPLFEKASQIFKSCLPIRWKGQEAAIKQIDPGFRISDTVYTTITINKDFRTACHRDAGDLCEPGHGTVAPKGFSNLTVVTNGAEFDGYYLCFPEFRVAVNVQAGDLLMMDAHHIHGNVPLISSDEGFERVSLVLYFRESMLNCQSVAIENLRRQFVYSRKDNKKHPLWRSTWNGVSPGMWDSQEWIDYLYNNGMPDEAGRVRGGVLPI